MTNKQIKKIITWAQALSANYEFQTDKEAEDFQFYLDLKWSGQLSYFTK